MENNKVIKIKVDGEKWKKALDSAYSKASSKFQVDGFRKGKAPRDIFIKKYGQERLNYDAADLCLGDAYDEMVLQAKDVEIVAQPDITVSSVDENGVEFLFTLVLKPEVKLGKYKGLGVKKDKVSVSDDEVSHEIEHLRGHFAENVVKDNGVLENGDEAIIDFEGFNDGVAFEGGKGVNYPLVIGSNTFIPGFEEQLIGMKVSEERDINVTFPDDYHAEDLKGKDVVFKVKVNEIKTKRIPELNADFFEDLGIDGIDSKESLEKQVKENLLARKDAEAENKYIDDLLSKAASGVDVSIPDVMINEELSRMIRQYDENLKMQGLSLQQFYKYTNSTEDDFKEKMRDEAVTRITYRLMLEEIANVEKIEISDEAADEEAVNMASKYNVSKDEFLKEFGGIDMVKYDLKMRKAIDVLKG